MSEDLILDNAPKTKAVLPCLEGIIGLTDIECPCIDPPPEGHDQSASGLYLTDLVWIDAMMFNQKNCYCGRPIWELMQKCVSNAIRKFCVDLTKCIYSDNKYSRLAKFSGVIGKPDISYALQKTKKYAGFCLTISKTIKGGYLNICKLNLAFDCDTEIELNVQNLQTGEIKTIKGTTKAGQFNSCEVDCSLPMKCDDKYKIWYELPENCRPLNNKLHCCSKNKNKTPCLNFVDLGGFTTDDIENCNFKENLAFGIQLEAFIKCNSLEWICGLEKIGDFSMLDTVAQSILFAASSEFQYKTMNAGTVNSFMLLKGERAMKEMSKWKKGYTNNLQYIKQNIPLDMTDCMTCNSNQWGSKGTL